MARRKNQTLKTISKINRVTLILVLLFFVVGIGAGVGTMWYLTKNDTFKLNGETELTLNVGETYNEESAKIVAFGKDISSSVKIDGEVNTSKAGDYILKYSVDSFRFKGYILYRHIKVVEE